MTHSRSNRRWSTGFRSLNSSAVSPQSAQTEPDAELAPPSGVPEPRPPSSPDRGRDGTRRLLPTPMRTNSWMRTNSLPRRGAWKQTRANFRRRWRLCNVIHNRRLTPVKYKRPVERGQNDWRQWSPYKPRRCARLYPEPASVSTWVRIEDPDRDGRPLWYILEAENPLILPLHLSVVEAYGSAANKLNLEIVWSVFAPEDQFGTSSRFVYRSTRQLNRRTRLWGTPPWVLCC